MRYILNILFTLLAISSCRKEDMVMPSSSTDRLYDYAEVGDTKGFFLLNEGNMGSNKATLDYFDYETGIYSKNIFAERNPMVAHELGDVGSDMQIYDGRLYIVVNCSNFVEVMDLATAKHIGTVSIPNCRYIAFKDNYAYVSSYAGSVGITPSARRGYVAKIDLTTLEIVGECSVGYQPDELVIVGERLYVANSGGYMAPYYDNTLSVIDLGSFTELKKIKVATNPYQLKLDSYGHLWISSRGDYKEISSTISVLDTATNKVVKSFDIASGDMWLDGEVLYILSSKEFSSKSTYAVIDAKSQELLDGMFISDGTDKSITMPYSVAVNGEMDEIFITDAKNYVTPGKLHCYSRDGELKWSTTTGDIPAHIAFTEVQLEQLEN